MVYDQTILVSTIRIYCKKKKVFRNSSQRRGKRLKNTSNKSKMSEFIYHALGFCGEHWHPNAINMTAMFMIAALIIKSIKNNYETEA